MYGERLRIPNFVRFISDRFRLDIVEFLLLLKALRKFVHCQRKQNNNELLKKHSVKLYAFRVAEIASFTTSF